VGLPVDLRTLVDHERPTVRTRHGEDRVRARRDRGVAGAEGAARREVRGLVRARSPHLAPGHEGTEDLAAALEGPTPVDRDLGAGDGRGQFAASGELAHGLSPGIPRRELTGEGVDVDRRLAHYA